MWFSQQPDVKKLIENRDVDGLIKALRSNKDQETACEILAALEKVGDERTFPEIVSRIGSSQSELNQFVRKALLAIIKRVRLNSPGYRAIPLGPSLKTLALEAWKRGDKDDKIALRDLSWLADAWGSDIPDMYRSEGIRSPEEVASDEYFRKLAKERLHAADVEVDSTTAVSAGNDQDVKVSVFDIRSPELRALQDALSKGEPLQPELEKFAQELIAIHLATGIRFRKGDHIEDNRRAKEIGEELTKWDGGSWAGFRAMQAVHARVAMSRVRSKDDFGAGSCLESVWNGIGHWRA